MRTWRIWAAAAVAPVLGGCGTMSNLTDQAPAVRAYGGVQRDWMVLKMAQEDDSGILWGAIPSLAIDLPLSVVGDTLTLPYTLLRDPTFLRQNLVYDASDYERAAATFARDRSTATPSSVVE